MSVTASLVVLCRHIGRVRHFHAKNVRPVIRDETEGDALPFMDGVRAGVLPWIGEVQVADNPGRCEPGTGEINYAGVARALDEMGYRGPVGMEAFAANDPDAALGAFDVAFTI